MAKELRVVDRRGASLKGLLFYLGVGALCQVLISGTLPNPASALTWIWMLAWPIMLVLKAVYGAIVVFVVVGLVAWFVFWRFSARA